MRGVTSPVVRSLVVAEMRADWPRYSEFMVEAQRPGYLVTMALPGAYGGHPELVALSELYRVKIHVWGATVAHDVDIVAPNLGVDAPTVVLAHRNHNSAMNHYWAVGRRSHAVRSPSVPPMLACVRRVRVASPFP
jgi:hypothetical protein